MISERIIYIVGNKESEYENVVTIQNDCYQSDLLGE